MKWRFLAQGLCLLLLAGCTQPASETDDTPVAPPVQEEQAPEESESPEETLEETDPLEEAPEEAENLFASLPESFFFASGVGGWSTELSSAEDGTFSGLYHDTDMGDAGEEYPNGTVYTCVFSGQFSQPERLEDGSYSMDLERLETEDAPEEFYGDGVRYVASAPYGLEDAEELILYPPGFPTASLPEEVLFWTGWTAFDWNQEETIPFYGLYNVKEQLAFLAYPAEGTT